MRPVATHRYKLQLPEMNPELLKLLASAVTVEGKVVPVLD
jgi:hypothetical protein